MKKYTTLLVLAGGIVLRGVTEWEYESEESAAKAIAQEIADCDVVGLKTEDAWLAIPVESILYARALEVT